MLQPDPPVRRHSSAMPGDRRHSSILPGDRSSILSGDKSTCASIRQSVKRCLSPGWTNVAPEDTNNKVKRQQKNNPFLVMVGKGPSSSERVSELQEESGSRPSQSTDLIGSFGRTTVCSPPEGNRPSQSTDLIGSFGRTTVCSPPGGNHPSPSFLTGTDLIGSFGKTTSEDQGYDEPLSICPPAPPPCFMRKDSVPSATSRQINSDILDTYSSLPVLDTYSSFSPFIFPLPATSPDISRCSLSSARSYSTSYTSWTAPLVGHSDSCVPGSSILDGGDSTAPAGAGGTCGRMSRKMSRKMSSGRGFKRDSSADTSKDIDDIDDLELDELEELRSDDDEAVIEEEEDVTKRWGGSMASPDLAYGSMNGLCEDEHHSV